MNQESVEDKWRPTNLWTPVMISLIALTIIKLICLAIIVGGAENLSKISTYIWCIWISFVLNIPEGIFRKRWLQVALMFIIDVVSFIFFSSNPLAWSLVSLTLIAALLCHKCNDTNYVPNPGKIQYSGYIIAWTIISALVYCLV